MFISERHPGLEGDAPIHMAPNTVRLTVRGEPVEPPANASTALRQAQGERGGLLSEQYCVAPNPVKKQGFSLFTHRQMLRERQAICAIPYRPGRWLGAVSYTYG